MRERPESYDIFALVAKLRSKNINSNFLATIEDKFVLNRTLSAFDLYQLRTVAFRELKVWFNPEWAREIRVLEPPAFERIPGTRHR